MGLEYFSKSDEYFSGFNLSAQSSNNENSDGIEISSSQVQFLNDFLTDGFEELLAYFRNQIKQEDHLIHKIPLNLVLPLYLLL